MTDKWLEDIHNRMADYETDAPEGLWEDIEQQMSQRKNESRYMAKHATMRWDKFAYCAAAAAAIALIISFFPLRFSNGTDRQATKDVAVSADRLYYTETQTSSMTPIAAIIKEKEKVQNEVHITPSESLKEREVAATNTDTEQAEPAIGTTETAPQKENVATMHHTTRYYHASTQTSAIHNDTRWAVGLYTSGTTSQTISYRRASDFIVGAEPGDAEWNGSPMLGILLYNSGKEIETRTSHKQPIRIGLSLTHSISQRLSLETGITYTTLRSEIREGSDSHYFATEQKLQYIGIPINAKIKALSWRHIDIYASAGMMAEKCFSGKSKTDYILNGKKEDTTNQKTESLPYQVSANISVGIQYNIDNAASLYMEPGISYYFDDKSSLQTIYKEKPLNLNISAGFRLSL